MLVREPRIFCVDDDPNLIEIMRTIMMNYPRISSHLHHSIAGASKILNFYHYDVDAIILDMSLEDGSGRKFTSQIRHQEKVFSLPKPIAIFWYTGWPIDLNDLYDPNTQAYYAYSVAELFSKSIDAPTLIPKIMTRLGLTTYYEPLVLKKEVD